MATEFKLPELGENIESGELVRLMIKPGVSITEGEPVMELETDKAVVEVPSSVTGTIGETACPCGPARGVEMRTAANMSEPERAQKSLSI